MRWSEWHNDALREYWKKDPSLTRTARHLSKVFEHPVTRNMIVGKTRQLNLQYGHNGHAMVLAGAHPAVLEGRTLFPNKVVPPSPRGVLMSGADNRKLGAFVTKGRWKGMPIFSLTLEERQTCPPDCRLWRLCYGNHMHNARRNQHGPALEDAIEVDLKRLSDKHPEGFVVRLHVLGDFYSADYVRKWLLWLYRYPALRVFGYTAWRENTEIGGLVKAMRTVLWDRFSVRTSNSSSGPTTATYGQAGPGGLLGGPKVIPCPVQSGKSESCGACALCWAAPDKVIGFSEH